MKRTFFGLMVGGLLLVPGSASAQTFFDNYCVTGSFQVCSSVRVYSSGNTLTLQIWNLQGTLGDAEHTITSVGLYHSGSYWTGRFDIASATFVTPDGSEDVTAHWWRKPNEIKELGGVFIEVAAGSSDGGKTGVIGCAAAAPGQHWSTCNSFPNNPYLEVTFTLSEQFALDDLALRWRSTQLPDGSEVTCDTGGAGGIVCEQVTPPPMTVVPEPVTSVLLLSGLAGMAGARAAKRCRSTPESKETTELV